MAKKDKSKNKGKECNAEKNNGKKLGVEFGRSNSTTATTMPKRLIIYNSYEMVTEDGE